MLRWICRHYNHKLFMVMQVMHSLLEQPDPRPDSSPVGTDISRNLKLEVHHGRAVAALSGINPDERTGHRPVVLVRAEHPHSLLPDAHLQLEVIVISLRGYMTSTSESTASMIGHSRPTELSLNIFKTPKDITHNNKQIMKPPWNCFGISIRMLKHSTSLGGGGVPEGNMYRAFACFFSFIILHCMQ